MDRNEIFLKAYDRMEEWLSSENLFPKMRREVMNLAKRIEVDSGDKEAREEIIDRFYKDLDFGTGGLRGIMGAGTNRMNVYTVRRTTQGLANYLIRKQGNPENIRPGQISVAIAYDSRFYSDRFALETASVLAANKIRAYIYSEIMPTPMLSFAVRNLKCDAGIMVTASHNPANYNGYKVYDSKGCQVTEDDADEIIKSINELDMFKGARLSDKDLISLMKEGKEDSLVKLIPKKTVVDYLNALMKTRLGIDCSNLEVVYTPLNGTGNKPIRKILKMIGVGTVRVVKEQEKPDSNFPTCPYPNPEKEEALRRGLALCNELKSPDLLLASDPDADRLGVAVRVINRLTGETDYIRMTGNQIGMILFDFICQKKEMPRRPAAITTVVSTKMTEKIAKRYDVELFNVLPGFKYIGEKIAYFEEGGEKDRFIFGFEESIGYLSEGYVRDKDAVQAAMLVCEAAAFYKQMGKTLFDRMEELYIQHGYYEELLVETAFIGEEGMAKMKRIVENFAIDSPKTIAKTKVIKVVDHTRQTIRYYDDPYREAPTGLPAADMIELHAGDESRVIIRPSGTEPKLKVYILCWHEKKEEAERLIKEVEKEVRYWLKLEDKVI